MSKIERSIYSRRRRVLFDYKEKIRLILSAKLSEFTDVFVVDSVPIEIYKVRDQHALQSALLSTLDPILDIAHLREQDTLGINFMLSGIKLYYCFDHFRKMDD